MKTVIIGMALVLPLPAAAISPYISRVYEYCPAPGQFVNEIPLYEEGDTYATILAKAEEQICGDAHPGLISLGAFGGYVTFGFDHPVVNSRGSYDFKVYGNAFIRDREAMGGSCEPGIIMVSADTNGNGLPDDEWFEIKGSEYDNPATVRDFRITYYKPEPGHIPTPDPESAHITDAKYIRWTSSGSPAEGWMQSNDSHKQDYWPLWLDDETLSFSGTRLPDNASFIESAHLYLLKAYGEGYADNMPNNETPGVKIDRAVKADGTPASLSQIDFVRVYTALNQTCGWIGESSTEVSGAEDLHPDMTSVEAIPEGFGTVTASVRGRVLSIRSGLPQSAAAAVYGATGAKVLSLTVVPGENRIDCSGLAAGVYILAAEGAPAVKVVVR